MPRATAPKPTTQALPGDKIGPNLSVTREGNIVSFHVDAEAELWTNEKTGKSLLATSRGFAKVSGVNASINILPNR